MTIKSSFAQGKRTNTSQLSTATQDTPVKKQRTDNLSHYDIYKSNNIPFISSKDALAVYEGTITGEIQSYDDMKKHIANLAFRELMQGQIIKTPEIKPTYQPLEPLEFFLPTVRFVKYQPSLQYSQVPISPDEVQKKYNQLHGNIDWSH